MKLPSRSKSTCTLAIALLVGVSLSTLAGSAGCTDSSGGLANAGAASGEAGGGMGGAAGGLGGGGAADTGAGGAAGNGGGGAGGGPNTVGACVDSTPITSGIDPTTRLDALTPEQKAAYCDWAASRYCGYGHRVDCGDGSFLGVDSQEACVKRMDNTVCASTVGENESCERQTSCLDQFPDSCLAVSMCQ